MKIFGRTLGGHQDDFGKNMRRRRLVCDKRQSEVIDDPVHNGILSYEGDDLHHAAALGLLRLIMLHLTYLFIKESPLILVNLFK